MSLNSLPKKPVVAPGPAPGTRLADLKAEAWVVKVVLAHGLADWFFSCDGVVVEELRKGMLEKRPTRLVYHGTEVLLNPDHVVRIELQKQETAS